MKDFKKRGSFGGDRGGKSFGGGFRGPREGGFGGGNRDRFNRPGNRDFRQSQMFSATCAECSKPCEVPFRPNGDKPVYCNYCFNKNKPTSAFAPRRDNDRRDNDFGGRSNVVKSDTQNADLASMKKQIESIGAKLDKIIALIGAVIQDSIEEVAIEAASPDVARSTKPELADVVAKVNSKTGSKKKSSSKTKIPAKSKK